MNLKLNELELQNCVIFGLTASENLAQKISEISKIPLGEKNIKRFADKEIFVEILTSVREKDIFIIQSTSTPANDHLMELLIFLDALKRASAKKVTVIMPYFGYSRQDRKAKGRQPISAKLVADLLTVAGASRIISFDIHSEQLQGFFDIPFDNLKAHGPLSQFFIENVKDINVKNAVVVSPDHGGVTRARNFAKRFNLPLAIIDKRRPEPNKVEIQNLIGEVKNKHAIIVDDIVDTAGTMAEAIKFLKQEGANKVHAIFTHPVLSQKENDSKTALDKLIESGVETIFTTNSICNNLKSEKMKVLDLSTIISDIIVTHIKHESVSNYFDKKWSW